MSNFVIMVDASSDLPLSYIEKHGIHLVPMNFTLDGEVFVDDGGVSYPHKAFYNKLREGSTSSTSMINTETFVEHLTQECEAGNDVLVVPLTSGLSGTAQSAQLAAEELAPRFPDRKIRVIDARVASLGAGLAADYMVRMRDEGKTIDECADWLERHHRGFQHIITADDLKHLQRGGRISKSTAFLGTLMSIKPLIHMDKEGTLHSVGKSRGRKAALEDLVSWMSRLVTTKEFDVISISHSDCEADADIVIADIKKRFKVDRVIKNYIGPLIGSHTGPGTIALFFLGKDRE